MSKKWKVERSAPGRPARPIIISPDGQKYSVSKFFEANRTFIEEFTKDGYWTASFPGEKEFCEAICKFFNENDWKAPKN